MAAVYFVGVDVGTASVRAGLFDQNGILIKSATQASKIWNPQPNFYEQSSDNIWECCCQVVKNIVSNIDASNVQGIGFDGTCSLVVLDSANKPVTISPTGKNEQNIIMWMDHRAGQETETINSTQHSAFKFVGGKVSIEMQLPKLLWLKNNIPQTWKVANSFMDLPDYLTWRATGIDSRSQCSVVCKWNYIVDETGKVQGWSKDLLEQVGLGELLDNNAVRIGRKVIAPGSVQVDCATLSSAAALELGLSVGTPVGVSLIDAYAGALGLLACRSQVPINERLALICGTSACHMLVTPRPVFVQGVWGPYADVLLKGNWLLEAGQSAVGKLLDHVIETHPCYHSLKARIPASSVIPEELVKLLHSAAQIRQLPSVARLAKDVHVWPDFHGNRSPLADPNLKGMISGLVLDTSEYNLALLYLATIQALCYGTRHIMDALRERQIQLGCILLCGGLVKSELFVTTLASAVGLPIIIPDEQESVLLGAAMLGANASGRFTSLEEAMIQMGGEGRIVLPDENDKQFHNKKYKVFLKMLGDQKAYENIMNDAEN